MLVTCTCNALEWHVQRMSLISFCIFNCHSHANLLAFACLKQKLHLRWRHNIIITSVNAEQDGGRYEQEGIVLVHGFGAGVFAWRHIMQPLAQKCGCRVIAFDRPGFGEQS